MYLFTAGFFILFFTKKNTKNKKDLPPLHKHCMYGIPALYVCVRLHVVHLVYSPHMTARHHLTPPPNSFSPIGFYKVPSGGAKGGRCWRDHVSLKKGGTSTAPFTLFTIIAPGLGQSHRPTLSLSSSIYRYGSPRWFSSTRSCDGLVGLLPPHSGTVYDYKRKGQQGGLTLRAVLRR